MAHAGVCTAAEVSRAAVVSGFGATLGAGWVVCGGGAPPVDSCGGAGWLAGGLVTGSGATELVSVSAGLVFAGWVSTGWGFTDCRCTGRRVEGAVAGWVQRGAVEVAVGSDRLSASVSLGT